MVAPTATALALHPEEHGFTMHSEITAGCWPYTPRDAPRRKYRSGWGSVLIRCGRFCGGTVAHNQVEDVLKQNLLTMCAYLSDFLDANRFQITKGFVVERRKPGCIICNTLMDIDHPTTSF